MIELGLLVVEKSVDQVVGLANLLVGQLVVLEVDFGSNLLV